MTGEFMTKADGERLWSKLNRVAESHAGITKQLEGQDRTLSRMERNQQETLRTLADVSSRVSNVDGDGLGSLIEMERRRMEDSKAIWSRISAMERSFSSKQWWLLTLLVGILADLLLQHAGVKF